VAVEEHSKRIDIN